MFLCSCFNSLKVTAKVILRKQGKETRSHPNDVLIWDNHMTKRLLQRWLLTVTWETRRWFSLSHVSLMAALRSKRRASCSSFSWRINSVLRANSRSCSALSRRSQAYNKCTNNRHVHPRFDVRSNARVELRWWHLVDVRDEFSFSRCEDLLVVGPHLTLDGEQKNFQVSFFCEPSTIISTHHWILVHLYRVQDKVCYFRCAWTDLGGFSTVLYVLNACSCCWTPTREFANFLLLRMIMVCSIHSKRSDARDSYFSIIFSVSMAWSRTWIQVQMEKVVEIS